MTSPNEIWAKQSGEVILALQGKLKKVYKPESKSGSKGPYTLQGAIMESEKGDIRISVFDNEIPTTYEGEMVEFVSPKGQRGYGGVQVDEYNGKKQLKVSKMAVIRLADQLPGAEVPSTASPGAPSLPPNSPAKASLSAEGYLDKAGALMTLVLARAVTLRAAYEVDHGEPMDVGQFQAITSTLFIAADKRGYVDQM